MGQIVFFPLIPRLEGNGRARATSIVGKVKRFAMGTSASSSGSSQAIAADNRQNIKPTQSIRKIQRTVKGDLPFLGDELRMPQFNSNTPCWFCEAIKKLNV